MINSKALVCTTGLVLLAAAEAPTAIGQESEPIPTMKLDRIAASPAFAGQTQAPAAALPGSAQEGGALGDLDVLAVDGEFRHGQPSCRLKRRLFSLRLHVNTASNGHDS